MINNAAPTNQVLAIKSLEAMEKVADGKATKIIIPSNLQGLAGLTTTASELFKAE
jgi:regulator of protease activity HflC (stomatin/prohibitin superfamily)